MFFYFLFSYYSPYLQVGEAVGIEYFIDISIDKDYGLKGETVAITVYTNYTGYNLKIYDPLNVLVYNQNHLANTTQDIPINGNAEYGTYTVIATIPVGLIITYFSVLDITDWTLPDFPHNVTHLTTNYKFSSDWELIINDEMTVDYIFIKDLIQLYNLEFLVRNNSMNFLLRIWKDDIFKIDILHSFIWKGVKIIVNGTSDRARQLPIDFSKFKKYLNSFRSGNIIFDYSDIRNAVTVDRINKRLLLHIPKGNFRLDPYIFESGFENDWADWDGQITASGCTANISTDPVLFETKSAEFYIDGNNDWDYALTEKDLDSYNKLSIQFWFMVTTLPTDDKIQGLIQIQNLTNGHIVVAGFVNETGTADYKIRVTYYDDYNKHLTGDAITILPNVRYLYELTTLIDNTNGWISVGFNNSVMFNQTGLDTDDKGFIDNFGVGSMQSLFGDGAFERTVYIDDVIVNDEYLGDIRPTNILGITQNELVVLNYDEGSRILFPFKWYEFRANVTEGNYTLLTNEIAFTDGVKWSNTTYNHIGNNFTRDLDYDFVDLNLTSSYNTTDVYNNVIIHYFLMIKGIPDNVYNISLYMRSEDINNNVTGWDELQDDYANIFKAILNSSIIGDIGNGEGDTFILTSFIVDNAVLIVDILLIVLGIVSLRFGLAGLLGMGIGFFTIVPSIASNTLDPFTQSFSIIAVLTVILLFLAGAGIRIRNK
jgi:hypothetical protein